MPFFELNHGYNEKGFGYLDKIQSILPVSITAQPQNVSGYAGDVVNISIAAENATDYAWEVSSNGGVSWATTGTNSATIAVTIASNMDAWLWRCTVSNAISSQVSTSAELDVLVDLTVLAHVGASTLPVTNSNKAVTGVGFTPKAVIPFATYTPSDGVHTSSVVAGWAPQQDTYLSLGATTASLQGSISSGLTSGADRFAGAYRRSSNAAVLSQVSSVFMTTYEIIRATRASLDADGFTFSWIRDDISSAPLFNHLSLGGTDLEVSLTRYQLNNTNVAQSFAHGLSGAPTAIVVFSSYIGSVLPWSGNVAIFQFGAWAGGNQFATCSYHPLGGSSAPSVAKRAFSSAHAFYNVTTVPQRAFSISSVTDTNINVAYTGPGVVQAHTWFLALRGCKAQVGTFDCAGSLSPTTISCAGIRPKLWWGAALGDAKDNSQTVRNDALYTIGASDGTRTVSCGITDQEVHPSNAKRYQSSSSFVEYDVSGVKQFEAGVTFSGQSVVITPTVNNSSSYGQGGYLIIGS